MSNKKQNWTYHIRRYKFSGEKISDVKYSSESVAQSEFDKETMEPVAGTYRVKHPYTEHYHSGVIGSIKLDACLNWNENHGSEEKTYTRRELNIKA